MSNKQNSCISVLFDIEMFKDDTDLEVFHHLLFFFAVILIIMILKLMPQLVYMLVQVLNMVLMLMLQGDHLQLPFFISF